MSLTLFWTLITFGRDYNHESNPCWRWLHFSRRFNFDSVVTWARVACMSWIRLWLRVINICTQMHHRFISGPIIYHSLLQTSLPPLLALLFLPRRPKSVQIKIDECGTGSATNQRTRIVLELNWGTGNHLSIKVDRSNWGRNYKQTPFMGFKNPTPRAKFMVHEIIANFSPLFRRIIIV